MNKKIDELYEKLSYMHSEAKCELNFSSPFELLVAVILSAQCTDKRVNAATENLFKVFNTPEQFSKLSLEELKPYIFSCGFYNNKGKNIIAMSKSIMDKHNGIVPYNFNELVELNGVGRKTASVVLCVAFGIPSMPVDTHVFRVSKRIGLSKAKDPDGVENDIKKLIEKEKWCDFHHYLLFHGRYVCHSRKPDCKNCGIKDLCEYKKEKEDIDE